MKIIIEQGDWRLVKLDTEYYIERDLGDKNWCEVVYTRLIDNKGPLIHRTAPPVPDNLMRLFRWLV